MSSSEELERVLEKSKRLALAHRDAENEALLRSELPRFPDDAELTLRTATAVLAKAPDEAKELVRRAVSLAPEDPWKLTRCAHLMFSLGELDDARTYTKRASAHAPDNFEYGPELLHVAGKLAAAKGNDELAERLLSLAFQGDPAFPGHGRVLAEFYLRQRRSSDALDVLDEALAHRPDDEALQRLRRGVVAARAE